MCLLEWVHDSTSLRTELNLKRKPTRWCVWSKPELMRQRLKAYSRYYLVVALYSDRIAGYFTNPRSSVPRSIDT